jgi:hypothetical protein
MIDEVDARRFARFVQDEFLVGVAKISSHTGPDCYGADYVTTHAIIGGVIEVRIYPGHDVPYWIKVRSKRGVDSVGMTTAVGRETFKGIVGPMMDDMGLGGFRSR